MWLGANDIFFNHLGNCSAKWNKHYVALSVGGGLDDLWTFRDLEFSRVVLSRPMIGPFATRYFRHLFDPSRFATSVIFAVCCFAY